jgi:hypothetical protein
VRPAALVAWAAGIAAYFAIAGVQFLGMPGPFLSPVGASLPAFGVAGLVHLAAARFVEPSAGRAPT